MFRLPARNSISQDRKASEPLEMAKTVDLKSTLNLPKTDFPMKAKLPEREPAQLAAWEAKGLYYRILESRADAPLFVLHDGPPYPTGEIHLGTGLNKIVKDMIVKSKTMSGFRSPYIPGWDCHGLPIETKVEKELGGKTSKVPAAEFRRMCRAVCRAASSRSTKREFKRLGVFGQWDKPYLTMDPRDEASIAGAFIDFYEKGYVYRGLKPVYWCIYDRTALAEAEVEYEDHTSPSIWVKFPVVAGEKIERAGLGWRRQRSDLDHHALDASREPRPRVSSGIRIRRGGHVRRKIAARERARECFCRRTAKSKFANVRGGWKGWEFEGVQFQHPFLDMQVPGVLADYVTLDQGSGIVHTAPGHGADDFRTGQKYGLEAYAPQDDEGRFIEGLPEYKGKTVFEANPIVIELLKKRGMLVGEEKITHSYPHCWRCHNPVIFRATEQWFIQMDAGTAAIPAPKAPPLRQRALEEIEKVKWLPAWGHDRMQRNGRGASRLVHFAPAILGRAADRFLLRCLRQATEGCRRAAPRSAVFRTRRRRRLVHAFRRGIAAAGNEMLLRRARNGARNRTFSTCGSIPARRISPCSRATISTGPPTFTSKAPTNIAAGSKARCWWASARAALRRTKQVVTHGWTLDEKGAPMSKSLGNAIYPAEICAKWGADLLRIWVVSQDYTADVRISEAMMTQLAEAYRKIRNTFRFALSNLYDFDPARDSVADADLWEMDAWMLRRTGALVRECREWYDNFEFHRVYHALHDFCTVDLSSFYFDVLKDRLYTFAPKNLGRRSAQTAVYRIASALLRLIAPITVFTAEEVWKHLPRAASEPESVHMAMFPVAAELERVLERGASEGLGSLARSPRRGAESARAGARREDDFLRA